MHIERADAIIGKFESKQKLNPELTAGKRVKPKTISYYWSILNNICPIIFIINRSRQLNADRPRVCECCTNFALLAIVKLRVAAILKQLMGATIRQRIHPPPPPYRVIYWVIYWVIYTYPKPVKVPTPCG